jgi:hypothetical protein
MPRPYAYTVLRSSPTGASLTHLASSPSSEVPSRRPVPPSNDIAFRVDMSDPLVPAGPSHRPYPRPSASVSTPEMTLHPQDHDSTPYVYLPFSSDRRPRPLPHVSPVLGAVGPSGRRAKPPSEALAYQHGEMIMDTTPDHRDGSLDPEEDGEDGMIGQPGAGQGKKHICPTCSKRFNRPSSLRIHVNTHTGATRGCFFFVCFKKL